jgi:hypothetical protein
VESTTQKRPSKSGLKGSGEDSENTNGGDNTMAIPKPTKEDRKAAMEILYSIIVAGFLTVVLF